MAIQLRSLAWFIVVNSAALAQAPVKLHESFVPGTSYSVRTSAELSGRLTLPSEKGKATPVNVSMNGASTIEYDERILPPLADRTGQRTVRVYRAAEARRTVGEQAQQTTLRPVARRMVVLRFGSREVPFSPDGPLTFGEIDLVRTDIFQPALAGLLPNQPVKIGDRWPVSASAIEELTDMEKIAEGGLECRLESTSVDAGRHVANISFGGTIRGVNEDGPNQQQLTGSFKFDLDGSYLSELALTGVNLLLDPQGKSTGRVEGKFRLVRRPLTNIPELVDAALKGLVLEPNPSNTLLVYESSVAGVRFLYPRRWRVSAEHGRQVTLDEPHGNGILITAEPTAKVPATADFLKETQNYLAGHQGKILRNEPAQRLQAAPREIDRFALDVELNRQPARMEYFIARQTQGGATIAARLLPNDAAVLRLEVEQIVKSLAVGTNPPAGVVPLPGK